MFRKTILLAVGCASLWTSPALAQSATSSANALTVNQTATIPSVASVNVSVGPVAATSGSAPPSYDASNSVLSLNQTAGLGVGPAVVTEQLQTALLSSSSAGTATGATATGTVNDLSLGLRALIDPNLLTLTATTVKSTSQANSVGGLDASGTTTIEGLLFTGSIFNNLSIDASAFASPLPNTVLLNIGGLSIILNKQTALGDGVTGIGIATNAISVGFNNFVSGTGLVNGTINIANSQAFATIGATGAVPEPATWALMLLGFAAVGWSLRRHKAGVPVRSMA